MKLLCQLWSLNESLQDYRKSVEEEESQREVASILEAHLEDEDDEEEEDEEDEDLNHLRDELEHERGGNVSKAFIAWSTSSDSPRVSNKIATHAYLFQKRKTDTQFLKTQGSNRSCHRPQEKAGL